MSPATAPQQQQPQAPPEPRSEQEVVQRFQELRQGAAELQAKIADLEAEAHEHELVITVNAGGGVRVVTAKGCVTGAT